MVVDALQQICPDVAQVPATDWGLSVGQDVPVGVTQVPPTVALAHSAAEEIFADENNIENATAIGRTRQIKCFCRIKMF